MPIFSCGLCRLRNVEVQWIYGNPLDYDDLSAKIDVTRSAHSQFGLIRAAAATCSPIYYTRSPYWPAGASLSCRFKLNHLISLSMCRYSTAIVLCDQSWIDPDLDDTNGIQVREQRDMLRLESQILLVQLHIRKSLTVSSPSISVPFQMTPLTAELCILWGVGNRVFVGQAHQQSKERPG